MFSSRAKRVGRGHRIVAKALLERLEDRRMLSAGNLDATFGTGGKVVTDFSSTANDFGRQVVVAPDGKIVVVGFTNQSGSPTRSDFALARYNSDGSLDSSFGSGGKVVTDFNSADDLGLSLVIQSDGKIVAAGVGSTGSTLVLARYQINGTLDGGFGSGGKVVTAIGGGSTASVGLGSGGKIILGGSTAGNFVVSRYNANGSTDTTFGATATPGRIETDLGGADVLNSIVVQPDGNILAAGFSAGTNINLALVRYTSDGNGLDTTFNGTGQLITSFGAGGSSAQGLALQSDGKIVAAGVSLGSGNENFALLRLNSDGTFDASFDGDGKVITDFGGNDSAMSVLIQGDGKIVAGGSSAAGGFALARYTAGGSLDSSFGTGGKVTTSFSGGASAFSVALQPDGKVVASGQVGINPNLNFGLARYITSTSNSAPLAVSANITTAEDVALSGAVAATDGDNDVLAFKLIAGPSHGTLQFQANGSFLYSPAANFNGSDSFRFSASDGAATSNVATVSISVTPVNDPPQTQGASFSVNEDGLLVRTLTASDIDSTTLTFLLDSTAAHGTLSLSAGGSFSYAPSADFNGTDSFTFHVSDGALSSGMATVSIAVTPVNDAPTTHGASFNVDEDGSIVGALTASDIDSTTLTFLLDSTTAHGTLSLSAGGSFSYVLSADFNGTDSFTFHVSDGELSSGVATATITVNPVNDAPTANSIDVSLDEDSSAAGQVSGQDVDGDTLAFVLLGGPEHGTVHFDSNGTYNYTPAANYNGLDSFTFSASDGSLSDIGSVNLTIRAINDAPIANNASVSVNEDAGVNIVISGQDVETNPAQLSFTIISLPQHGALTYQGADVNLGDTLIGSPAELHYEVGAACDDVTSDSFSFTVTDNGDGDSPALTSSAANVAISINRLAPASAALGADGILRISGTSGDDSISVRQQGSALQVLLNGQSIGGSIQLSNVAAIRIWGRSGNDNIDVSDLPIDTFIHGGDGDDVLTGGSGNDLILGGGGNDHLTGASGNDFLIGGDGSDRIVGSAGHDVLTAGDIDCHFTANALRAISAAWAADKTVSADDAAAADDVITDDDYDMLTGASGADWFIISAGDKITDLAKTVSKDGDVITYVN